jgi:DNA-binding NarL/FixJ family response regulator
MKGHPYLTPRLRTQHWEEAKAKARHLSEELTNRQRDVLQLFAEGRSQKEIASLLHLSQKTVEFHKHHIMESFNLRSNADLVLFAVKQGLIHVDKAHACLSYLPD